MQDDKQRELLQLHFNHMKEQDKISKDEIYAKKVKRKKRIIKIIITIFFLFLVYYFIETFILDISFIVSYLSD